MKVPPKLIAYFEKRIQELKSWEQRLSKCRTDQERSDYLDFSARREAVESVFKYVKGGRWLK